MTQLPSTNPVSQAIQAQSQSAGQTPNRFSEMQSEDFIKVIFTELTNQDPLNPQDTSALLDQLDSIRSIESDLKITNRLKELVTQNQFASASNLIGKVISGRTESLTPVAGQVVAVRQEGDQTKLELNNGQFVPFNNVESIHQPPPNSNGPSGP